MAKVKIVIEEELKYRRTAIFEIPEGNPGTIDDYLDKAEEFADSAAEVVYRLKSLGCKVEGFDESFDSPRYSDAEVIDYEIVEEE